MNKIKLEFPKEKKEKFVFEYKEIVENKEITISQEIILDKYIDTTTKKILSTIYFNLLNDEDIDINDRYFYAEIYLILTVVKLCTNIEFEEGKEEEFVNNVIKSGLWYKVKDLILNYSEFRRELGSAIQFVNSESLLNKTVNVLALKLSDLIDKVSSVDFTNIDIEKLNKVLEDLRQERINIGNTLYGGENKSVKKPKKVEEKILSGHADSSQLDKSLFKVE